MCTPSCLINWVECNLVWNHMGHLKIKQACKASFIWNLKGVLKLNYEVELPLHYIHFEITKFSGWQTLDFWSILISNLELCTRDGWLKADRQWSRLHPWSLFLSLDLVHRKTIEKGVKVVLKTGLHCTDLKLCTRDEWLTADQQWGELHPWSLFLSLDLWF